LISILKMKFIIYLLFEKHLKIMEHNPLIIWGDIPEEDMDKLGKMGVGKLFGPGSNTQDIVKYINDWFVKHRQN